jgi:hypothetical protein
LNSLEAPYPRAKFFTAQHTEKKQQKRFAAVRHGAKKAAEKRTPPSLRRAAFECGLIPPYPVPSGAPAFWLFRALCDVSPNNLLFLVFPRPQPAI